MIYTNQFIMAHLKSILPLGGDFHLPGLLLEITANKKKYYFFTYYDLTESKPLDLVVMKSIIKVELVEKGFYALFPEEQASIRQLEVRGLDGIARVKIIGWVGIELDAINHQIQISTEKLDQYLNTVRKSLNAKNKTVVLKIVSGYFPNYKIKIRETY